MKNNGSPESIGRFGSLTQEDSSLRTDELRNRFFLDIASNNDGVLEKAVREISPGPIFDSVVQAIIQERIITPDKLQRFFSQYGLKSDPEKEKYIMNNIKKWLS